MIDNLYNPAIVGVNETVCLPLFCVTILIGNGTKLVFSIPPHLSGKIETFGIISNLGILDNRLFPNLSTVWTTNRSSTPSVPIKSEL